MRMASSVLVFVFGKMLVSRKTLFLGRLFRQRAIESPYLIEDVDLKDLESVRSLKWLVL